MADAEKKIRARIAARVSHVESSFARGTVDEWQREVQLLLRLIGFYSRWSRKQGYNEGYAAGIKESVRQFCCVEARGSYGE